MECWLVRHGETSCNSEGRFQGRLDAPLSPRGHAQAAALAAGLAGTRFDALYTSPLSRARETAVACGSALGLEPIALDDLREIGLGAWEGLTLETVRARDGERYRRWREAPVAHPPAGGEPMAGLAGRVRAALDGLTARHPAGRVLVVSHGGAIASALCAWLGRPLDAIWSLRLDNASITRVVLPAGRLLAWNETRHLDGVAAEAAAP
ncbi:MAG TPA: histidine phosphatase family protein [Methylomirabilota bacterium]|jgi:broad specificity phosphatase PhoE